MAIFRKSLTPITTLTSYETTPSRKQLHFWGNVESNLKKLFGMCAKHSHIFIMMFLQAKS